MTRSPAYRLLVLLAALTFGLGWAAPLAHAACGSLGSTALDRCATSGSAKHCESDLGPTSVVCLSHHASQEALTGTSSAPDVQGGGSGGMEDEQVLLPAGAVVSSSPSGRRAAERSGRLHLRVGVWLE